MSAPGAAAGDGGAAQAVEAHRPAAAAAAAAADGDGAQQGQHYNEVAENYETGKLVSRSTVSAGCSNQQCVKWHAGQEQTVPFGLLMPTRLR